MCLKLGFRLTRRFKGTFRRGQKTLRRLLNLDVFGGFAVGKLRFPRSSFSKLSAVCKKSQQKRWPVPAKAVFALVAVPEDILLQLAEELRVLLSVAEKLQILRRRRDRKPARPRTPGYALPPPSAQKRSSSCFATTESNFGSEVRACKSSNGQTL